MNDLGGLAADGVKSRAPDLVTPDDFKQAPCQHVHVQRAPPVDGHSFVIESTVARHLPMKPDLLLRGGKGCRLPGWPTTDHRPVCKILYKPPAQIFLEKPALPFRKPGAIRLHVAWMLVVHTVAHSLSHSNLRAGIYLGSRSGPPNFVPRTGAPGGRR